MKQHCITKYISIWLALIIMFLGIYAISQNWKMMNYTEIIDNLTNKLNSVENKLFNLGNNLWNKQYVYDLKFIIYDDNNEHEFYAHKYILMANSKYFKNLLVNETINNITYIGISKSEFNSIMELLYSGKFKTPISLSQFPHIFEYMDKFLVLPEYSNYLDSYFANRFNNHYNETFNIELVSNIYDIASQHNLTNLTNAILKNIYHNWKYDILNKQHVINYPSLFYDYIKSIKCAENRILFG